jgi:hypothetical protein
MVRDIADPPENESGTAPLRQYVEAKDSNGVWFVVGSHATRADAEQEKRDWDKAEPTPSRIVERPEGEETPVQDDTSEVVPPEDE